MPIIVNGVPQDAEDSDAVTYWVIYDDGSIGKIETTGGPPTLPKPGRFVTEEEYRERAEELDAAHREHLERLRREEEARTWADFKALLDAGVPEETARRLSGYTGPVEGPEDPGDISL